jgi:putative protease
MKAGEQTRLTLQNAQRSVTVLGDIPLLAQNAPMTAEAVAKNLCRFGNTPYAVENADIRVAEGLMMPVSRLNALRRAALAALTDMGRPKDAPPPAFRAPTPVGRRTALRSARFESPQQITAAAVAAFPCRYLPLHRFAEAPEGVANGVVIPPVVFDGEWGSVADDLKKAAERGAKHALVGNVGHLPLALGAGLLPHGDLRLNVMNEGSLAVLLQMGFADVILSPELSLPQLRDVRGAAEAVVYGRVPLMLLEKCAGREVGSCAACAEGCNQYTDRRGEKFPVFRVGAMTNAKGETNHRNVLYNCRPTVMSDRGRDLLRAGIRGGHYIFSTESAAEVDRVISAYRDGTPLGDKIRRI